MRTRTTTERREGASKLPDLYVETPRRKHLSRRITTNTDSNEFDLSNHSSNSSVIYLLRKRQNIRRAMVTINTDNESSS